MAEKSEQMKAGKYEIVTPNTRYRQTTSKPGQPHEWTEYQTGDIVELTAEEADRLKDVIGKPGEAARREAARHRAEAERLKSVADAAEERAKEREKAAKGGGSSPAPADGAPAGNASVEDWRAYALTQGATEDDIKDLSRDDLRDRFGAKS